MILRGLRNFGKSMKFYFTPLGVSALFFLIGLSILITGTSNAIKDLFNTVGQIVGDSKGNYNWGEVFHTIWNCVKALNWQSGHIVESLKTMISTGWIKETLWTSLTNVFGELKNVANQVMDAISVCVGRIVAALVIFLVLNVIGWITGYIVLALLVRSDLTHTNIFIVMLASLFDVAVVITTMILGSLLSALWSPLGIIFYLVSAVGFGMLAITEGFVLHGRGKVTLKEMLNFKSVALLILSNVIIVVTGIVTFLLCFLTGHLIIALALGVPLIELASVVTSYTGETYVLDYMKEKGIDVHAKKEKKHKKEKKAKKLKEKTA